MTVKNKRKLILFVVLPIVIFFLLFVPIVIGGGELQILLDTVGFRELGDDPKAMSNSIKIQGKESLTVAVHRDWEATSVTISSNITAKSIKAILKQKGHVDIVLGDVVGVQVATFANSYTDDNGEVMITNMMLSNHLNIDTNQYYAMEDISVWLEIIVDVSDTADVTVELSE